MHGRDQLSERRRRATSAWRGYVDRSAVPIGVRVEVAASWARSASHIRPDQRSAPVDEDARTADEWRSSALYEPVQALLPDLAAVAADEYVVAITDPHGKILFSLGGPHMRRAAERVNFVPGGRWDEASVGTNALDLALRTARPQQVFSAEHYTEIVHDWVCYSAPVADPVTGRPVGVLDLSSTWEHAHPFALATVSALARNLQAQVDGEAGATHLRLRTLGTAGDAAVTLDGRPVHVSPRQLELLTVLSLRPQGSTLEELHAALYPDHGATPGSCKAEVSHLRRLLGDTIGSRPYRLRGRVVADHLEVERLLEAGLVPAALALYHGALLARSESPAIIEHRAFLHVALRSAVLATGDPELSVALGRIDPDDVALHEHALALLAPTDPRRALVTGRLDRS